jgi:hypothetical protein
MALETHPTTVSIPREQLAQMEADRRQVQELLAQRELDATSANIRAQAAAGQVEQLARSHRQEIEAERNRAAQIAAKAELATALSRQPLLPHAAEQLTSILGSHISASPDGKGGYNVLSKDYRDVSTYVSDTLASPEFSHFRSDVKPQSPVNRPNQPAPETSIEQPRNFGEALVANYQQQRQATEAANSATDPRMDLSKPMGLGPARGGPAWGSAFPGMGRPR